MSSEPQIKQQVREFYDQVGWQLVGEDVYQNARYEDLRPVARDYIHRCHLRVARHLKPQGTYLLDAGSGPIQYPEYLEYSRSYRYRVCVDISQTAIKEARKRIGEHGLYVVADVANLPFKQGCFGAAISLHTIHHLPEGEHLQAYQELYRVLAEQASAVVVNGWPSSPLMRISDPLIRLGNRMRNRLGHEKGEPAQPPEIKKVKGNPVQTGGEPGQAKGTFTNRHDVAWIKTCVGSQMPVEILVWRSLSVRFMRSLIHPRLLGREWLSVIYWLEERLPHFFGENGQYPLIVIRKGSK